MRKTGFVFLILFLRSSLSTQGTEADGSAAPPASGRQGTTERRVRLPRPWPLSAQLEARGAPSNAEPSGLRGRTASHVQSTPLARVLCRPGNAPGLLWLGGKVAMDSPGPTLPSSVLGCVLRA